MLSSSCQPAGMCSQWQPSATSPQAHDGRRGGCGRLPVEHVAGRAPVLRRCCAHVHVGGYSTTPKGRFHFLLVLDASISLEEQVARRVSGWCRIRLNVDVVIFLAFF